MDPECKDLSLRLRLWRAKKTRQTEASRRQGCLDLPFRGKLFRPEVQDREGQGSAGPFTLSRVIAIVYTSSANSHKTENSWPLFRAYVWGPWDFKNRAPEVREEVGFGAAVLVLAEEPGNTVKCPNKGGRKRARKREREREMYRYTYAHTCVCIYICTYA